jgi:hypothetical protein
MLLAFATHTAAYLGVMAWRAAIIARGSAYGFFKHLPTITAYVVFQDWPYLLRSTAAAAIRPPEATTKTLRNAYYLLSSFFSPERRSEVACTSEKPNRPIDSVTMPPTTTEIIPSMSPRQANPSAEVHTDRRCPHTAARCSSAKRHPRALGKRRRRTLARWLTGKAVKLQKQAIAPRAPRIWVLMNTARLTFVVPGTS